MMERCHIYKGIGTPCKLRGVNTKYFYIMFCAVMLAGIMALSSLTGLIHGKSFFSFIAELLVEVGILIAMYVYFYRKSNKRKIHIDTRPRLISNRILYKRLSKNGK